jgi:hypothetical protein
MKRIKKLFTEQLKPFDFVKQSTDWYYNNDELTMVINLQKSNYDKLYFLNVAIWLNETNGINQFPKENHCHIRMRAEDLFKSIPKALNPRELFDFNVSISDKKIEDVNIFLKEYFGPSLNNLKSIDSLKVLYREDFFKYSYLEKNARTILSL